MDRKPTYLEKLISALAGAILTIGVYLLLSIAGSVSISKGAH